MELYHVGHQTLHINSKLLGHGHISRRSRRLRIDLFLAFDSLTDDGSLC